MSSGQTCPVCHNAIHGKDQDFVAHVNACLDKRSCVEDQLVCQICKKNITSYSTAQRSQHLNRCCDRNVKLESNNDAQLRSASAESSDFVPASRINERLCPACGKTFKSKKGVMVHVKKCAQKHRLALDDVATALEEQENSTQGLTGAATTATTTTTTTAAAAAASSSSLPSSSLASVSVGRGSGTLQSTRPTRHNTRKRVKAEEEDEDTQVALALSKSLLQTELVASDRTTKPGTRKKSKQTGVAKPEVPPLLQHAENDQLAAVAARAGDVMFGAEDNSPISCTPAFATSRLTAAVASPPHAVKPHNNYGRECKRDGSIGVPLGPAIRSECSGSASTAQAPSTCSQGMAVDTSTGVTAAASDHADIVLSNPGSPLSAASVAGGAPSPSRAQPSCCALPALASTPSDCAFKASVAMDHTTGCQPDSARDVASNSPPLPVGTDPHVVASPATTTCCLVRNSPSPHPVAAASTAAATTALFGSGANATPRTRHVCIIDKETSYFSEPVAGVRMGNKPVYHQLWRMSAGANPFTDDSLFYVPSLLGDGQRECKLNMPGEFRLDTPASKPGCADQLGKTKQEEAMSVIKQPIVNNTMTSFSQRLLSLLSHDPDASPLDSSQGAGDLSKRSEEFTSQKSARRHSLSKQSCCEKATEDVLADLGQLVASSRFSDAVLVASDGTRLPVHQVILAARSPVFLQMFEQNDDSTGLDDSTFNASGWSRIALEPIVLRFDDFEPSVLSSLLSYLYAGQLPAESDAELISSLYMLAVKLKLSFLQSFCEQHADCPLLSASQQQEEEEEDEQQAVLTSPSTAQDDQAVLTSPSTARDDQAMLTSPSTARDDQAVLTSPSTARDDPAMLTSPSTARDDHEEQDTYLTNADQHLSFSGSGFFPASDERSDECMDVQQLQSTQVLGECGQTPRTCAANAACSDDIARSMHASGESADEQEDDIAAHAAQCTMTRSKFDCDHTVDETQRGCSHRSPSRSTVSPSISALPLDLCAEETGIVEDAGLLSGGLEDSSSQYLGQGQGLLAEHDELAGDDKAVYVVPSQSPVTERFRHAAGTDSLSKGNADPSISPSRSWSMCTMASLPEFSTPVVVSDTPVRLRRAPFQSARATVLGGSSRAFQSGSESERKLGADVALDAFDLDTSLVPACAADCLGRESVSSPASSPVVSCAPSVSGKPRASTCAHLPMTSPYRPAHDDGDCCDSGDNTGGDDSSGDLTLPAEQISGSSGGSPVVGSLSAHSTYSPGAGAGALDNTELFLNDAGYDCDMESFSPADGEITPARRIGDTDIGCDLGESPCFLENTLSQLVESSNGSSSDLEPVFVNVAEQPRGSDLFPASHTAAAAAVDRTDDGSDDGCANCRVGGDIDHDDGVENGGSEDDTVLGDDVGYANSSWPAECSDMHDSLLLAAAVETDDSCASLPRALPMCSASTTATASTATIDNATSTAAAPHPASTVTPVLTSRAQSVQGKSSSAVADSPVTPMPNYDHMATPEVRARADRFGIRKLPKKRTITLLKHIYDYTHQPAQSRSNGSDLAGTPSLAAAAETPAANAPRSAESGGGDTAGGDDDQLDNDLACSVVDDSPKPNSGEEELGVDNGHIDMSKQFAGSSLDLDAGEEDDTTLSATQVSNEERVYTELFHFLSTNKQFYERILLYQPLDLASLSAALHQASIRYSQRALVKFLDSQCIVFH